MAKEQHEDLNSPSHDVLWYYDTDTFQEIGNYDDKTSIVFVTRWDHPRRIKSVLIHISSHSHQFSNSTNLKNYLNYSRNQTITPHILVGSNHFGLCQMKNEIVSNLCVKEKMNNILQDIVVNYTIRITISMYGNKY